MNSFNQFMIIFLFLLGIYYIITYQNVEAFDNINLMKKQNRCPDILLQKGSAFFLYNSKIAKVPGVNPVRFNSLEDYTEFIDWQRSQGIRCPIMYVQESYDAQGNAVYNVRPSPTNLQGGLPNLSMTASPVGSKTMSTSSVVDNALTTKLFDAGHDNMPFNKNSYPSYDGQNQYIGLNTPLDKMFNDNTLKGTVSSPNPMDSNWGGGAYTSSLVNAGYYAGNDVYIKPA
jgi:hypothetical protein